MSSDTLQIRRGRPSDITAIHRLVQEQAQHHNVPLTDIQNTPEDMAHDAFGEDTFFRFFVAHPPEQPDNILGAAIYYFTYSTWKGRSIYLEDLIVRQGMRGLGIGKQLFEALVDETQRLKVAKLKWQVAEDNAGAIRFYERYDVAFDSDWIDCVLTRPDIIAISQQEEERDR
ncbi:MAG: GNAT family N-acetyltransferase [Bernardetiaceae bacterium]